MRIFHLGAYLKRIENLLYLYQKFLPLLQIFCSVRCVPIERQGKSDEPALDLKLRTFHNEYIVILPTHDSDEEGIAMIEKDEEVFLWRN